MSPGDQIIDAFISSFFEVFVAILLGGFEAVIVPLLAAIPGLLGLAG